MNKNTQINQIHASIETLLEIKNGQQTDMCLHVQNCQHCQQELEALCDLQQQIFDTAEQTPAPELWDRIVESAELSADAENDDLAELAEVFVEPVTDTPSITGATMQEEKSNLDIPLELLAANAAQQKQQNSLSKAVYTLAASILVTGFIGMYMFTQQNGANQQSELLSASIQSLMLDSRGMEVALRAVELQDNYLTATEQSTADRLYWRLANVDQMIHDKSADAPLDPEQLERLWKVRIAALRELNQLYYQRQQSLEDTIL